MRQHVLRKFFVLILFLAAAHCVKAQQFSLSYAPDTGGNTRLLSKIHFISLDHNHRLPPLQNKVPYIFRLVLRYPPGHGGELITTDNEHLDSIFLYRREGEHLVLIEAGGNNLHNDSTVLGAPGFIVYGPVKEYFLRTRFKKDVSLGISISKLADVNRAAWEYLGLGFYYGLFFTLLLSGAVAGLIFRERIFIYYIFFQLAIFLSISYSDGMITFMITNRFILNNADIPLHLAMALSGFAFSGNFMSLQGRYLYRNHVITGMALIVTCLYIIHLVYQNYPVYLLADIICFSFLLANWIIGLLTFRQNLYSRYFVIAYTVYLVFMLDYYIARKFGFFFFDMIGGQMKIGWYCEMMVLSFAMAYRVYRLNEDNIRYRYTIEQYMKQAMLADEQASRELNSVFVAVKEKYDLTERETDVLKCITDGLTNNQIADKLFVSVNTIKYHTRNIFDKMEISSRAQAVSRVHQKSPEK